MRRISIAALLLFLLTGCSLVPGSSEQPTATAAAPKSDTPVIFTFETPSAANSVLATPQPGHGVDMDQVVMLRPGDRLKPYKGVTAIHHPEHYSNGIQGMSLLDVIEMLCDWKAATMRHADGDLSKSIEINQKRFGYSDELKSILINTAIELKFIEPQPKTDKQGEGQ
jgi:hypothetical protein